MVVQTAEVRRVWRQFIFTNEFTAVGSNPVLSQLAMCVGMVSDGVCFGWKGRLHFIPDKARVNAELCVEKCNRNILKVAKSVWSPNSTYKFVFSNLEGHV